MKTIRELAKGYLRARQAARHPRVVTSTKSYLYRLADWLETQRVETPGQLTSTHIVKWLGYVRSQNSRYTGLPLSLHSICGRIAAARAFFATLIREGFLPVGILEAFPRARKVPIVPLSTLKHADVRRVLRAIPSHSPSLYMLRTLSELAYTTAARPCELLALDVSDVNFERRLIRVIGKGQKERMLPVGKVAVKALENYVRAVRPLLLRNPGEKALWLSEKGRRLSYDRMLELLHLHVPKKEITWYTFRRSCATELARAGANLWAIKELLGHDHIETIRHYVHLTIEDLKKAHDRCHPRNLPLNENPTQ